MARCINCNIASHPLQQQHLYNALDMDLQIISIIEEWIAREVEDGDTICQECMDLLMREYYGRFHGIHGDRQLGHLSVCICCGITISQRTGRRSHPLPVGRPERDHIANIISPRQINADARACNACWLRANLYAPEVVEDERIIIPDDIVESGSSSVAEPVSVPSSDFERDSIHQLENENMHLDGYARTPDTSNHCFVPECANIERLRVPLFLKKKILNDNKIYVTEKNADWNDRICGYYCNCFVGKRTVGSCAHVMTIVWYLG